MLGIGLHTRVALKQNGCPLRFWGRTTKDFIKKEEHTLGTHEAHDT